jgi:hypothetical protein
LVGSHAHSRYDSGRNTTGGVENVWLAKQYFTGKLVNCQKAIALNEKQTQSGFVGKGEITAAWRGVQSRISQYSVELSAVDD